MSRLFKRAGGGLEELARDWASSSVASMFSGGGGYNGGAMHRRATLNWRASQGSADADLVPDLAIMRRRSRDAVRNQPIASGAIDRLTMLSIGGGLRPLPAIEADFLGLTPEKASEWERAASRRFRAYAESCESDFTDVQDFYGLQDMVFRSVLESADVLMVRRFNEDPRREYGTTFQFYESDQVTTPDGIIDGAPIVGGGRIVAGVELDVNGTTVAYYLRSRHPGDLNSAAQPRKWIRLPVYAASGRRQAWLLYDRRRIGQTRGVPYLAPVIEQLRMLSTYSEAELMAAVIGAMITVVHKSPTGDPLPNSNPNDAEAASDEPQPYTMESGTIFDIPADDSVEVPELGRPNANFDPFFVSICRQIGAGLNIPFEVLILHFTSSFSASKGALEMAWQFVMKKRGWTARAICQPIYNAAIEEDVLRGRLAAPGFLQDRETERAWLGCRWIGPGKIALQPMQEVQADKMSVDEGFETRSEVTARRTGEDWESKHPQSVKEQKMRVRDGLAVLPPAPGAAPGAPAQQPEKPEEE